MLSKASVDFKGLATDLEESRANAKQLSAALGNEQANVAFWKQSGCAEGSKRKEGEEAEEKAEVFRQQRDAHFYAKADAVRNANDARRRYDVLRRLAVSPRRWTSAVLDLL